MSDKKAETTEEALAAMRRYADIVELGPPPMGKAFADLLREYADRIEAAAKRERNAHTNDIHDALYLATGIPGNAAAMREALEAVLRNHDRMILPEICCPNCGEDFQLRGNLPPEITRKVKAALSDHARNCDRPFRLVEEAIGAYVTERGDGPHLGYCDAIKWMLDPAEGGEK